MEIYRNFCGFALWGWSSVYFAEKMTVDAGRNISKRFWILKAGARPLSARNRGSANGNGNGNGNLLHIFLGGLGGGYFSRNGGTVKAAHLSRGII